MARLIDAEPIKKFIVDGLNNPDLKKAFGHDAIEILTEIEYAPTVQAVEVVHGQWVDRYGGKYANPVYDCSECKHSAPLMHDMDMLGNWKARQYFPNYCPNCGAKMDGERKDNDI